MPHGRRREWPEPVNERRRAGSPEPRQTDLVREALAELEGPLAHGLVADGDAAGQRGARIGRLVVRSRPA
jgi:hypothetical protein